MMNDTAEAKTQSNEYVLNCLECVANNGSVLLVIFVHGFKGDDDTFGQFPSRLQHILSETIPHCHIECIVFPAYETKGDLNEAVTRFADWLTTITVEKEVASGGGAGRAKIVLCGHSMGGLLIADSLLEFVKSRPDEMAPLWPKIVACIAFDTPYLGLHPFIFKNSVVKAAKYADAAKTVGTSLFGSLVGLGVNKTAPSPPPANQARIELPANTSGWGKWAPAAYAVGGALLAGAAAGGAYYKREDLGLGYTWAVDHMKYVGNLWDEATLKKRLDSLVEVEKKQSVTFRLFYTLLPPAPSQSSPRTFVVLPKSDSPALSHFLPARNGNAELSEIDAHTGMFSPRTNDGYFELGLEAARIIRESMGPPS